MFGFGQFRPLQEQVIDKILVAEDVLLILPTGGGKSLCYQLPALLMDGVLVVVSPLIALMQNQVFDLVDKGIEAAMMSSAQTQSQINKTEENLQNGQIKILFVAPERLQMPQFLDLLKSIKISFFAVDEAHCVSQWGHEFRADYRQLGLLKLHFPQVGIAAFTATATTQVQKDITSQLKFSQTDNIICGQVYRENLFISTQARQGNGQTQLLDFLNKHKQQQGIIYMSSRKKTDSICTFLLSEGFSTRAYHAGLDTNTREDAFNEFMTDKVDIMVATVAFGMGIDKSNIRFVVHLSLPKTLEAYYQEMGRAGRDGLPSEVLLLYSVGDMGQLSRFIEEVEDENYRNLAYKKLNAVKQYAFSEQCRHQSLSVYFENQISACQTNCDNCHAPDQKRSDITQLAQMFLSAVYRTGQMFGQQHIINVLRGSKEQKIINNQHDKLSVYSIGSAYQRPKWRIISDRLLEIDALSNADFGGLKLGKEAMLILKQGKKVDIRTANLNASNKQIKEKPARKIITKYPVDDKIFQKLRTLRREIADETNMPAYIIFDDKTLNQMAYFLPNTQVEFLQINGVGQLKYEKYGERFLVLLSELRSDDFITPKKEEITNPSSEKPIEIQKIQSDTITLNTTQETTLSKSHQTTLLLIEKGLSVENICQERNFTIVTILSHINKLHDQQQITQDTKTQLFAQIPTNKELDNWVKQGIKLTGSINDSMRYMAIFNQLN